MELSSKCPHNWRRTSICIFTRMKSILIMSIVAPTQQMQQQQQLSMAMAIRFNRQPQIIRSSSLGLNSQILKRLQQQRQPQLKSCNHRVVAYNKLKSTVNRLIRPNLDKPPHLQWILKETILITAMSLLKAKNFSRICRIAVSLQECTQWSSKKIKFSDLTKLLI